MAHRVVNAMAKGLMARRSPARASRGAIRAKIRTLRAEGKPQDQAVATALSMSRKGRLTATGDYRRVGRLR